MTNLLIFAAAAVALVACVFALRRVPHGHTLAFAGMAIYAFWPLLRDLVQSGHGWFLVGAACGPFMYRAHKQHQAEVVAEARRRRALREQYREIGL